MTAAGTVLDALVNALAGAGAFNRNDQVPPVAVLWTDGERQWEPLLPRLRAALPLLTLGPYRPAERSGPAYWLRAVLAGALVEEVPLPTDSPAIIYLPGHSRQELRAVEECPATLRPLAELQYRGVLWTQKNGRDWTLAAFLQSADGGLGIEVGSDNATKQALQRAVRRLADEPIARLRHEAPLRAEFFDALLNPDEARSVLLWLNDPTGFRAGVEPDEWAAFREVCRRRCQFDPEKDGPVTAAGRLGKREAHWDTVWKRFAEAPESYPTLPELLRQARPAGTFDMFDRPECWPQDNEAAEEEARKGLLALSGRPTAAARVAIAKLEEQHAPRRKWVWAQLRQAPLARALYHLARLAQQTQKSLAGAGVVEIAAAYADWGWQADISGLYALAEVSQGADAAAVGAAIRALYRDWLDAGARAFQHRALSGNLAQVYPASGLEELTAGTCLLFSDGLRFDLAQGLARHLVNGGASAEVSWTLAALPSVTSTAKAAIAPVASHLVSGDDLTPRSPGGALVDVNVLRKLLVEAGYQVLMGDETGDPAGRAWTELGDIDSYGHDYGWKVAHHVAAELRAIVERVRGLLTAGWERVVVVTDHGFLLLPGGLPKAELPEHLTAVRKGRCARLKSGSTTDQPTVPWRFDSEVRIAVAPGISCYTANREYEHGGLSPQECVVPIVTVTSPVVAQPVSIRSIAWRGLRCVVAVDGGGPDLQVDLRTKAADGGSSLSGGAKVLAVDGTASLLVADDDRQGEAVLAVVLGPDGAVRAQGPTVVGG